jgi:YHS domain-containing protein
MPRTLLALFAGFLVVPMALLAIAEERAKPAESKRSPTDKETRAAIQEALAEFNPLVGGWRGVGQPVRNSNKGSWTETAEWIWEIKKEHVGLRYSIKDGKQLTSALLTWDPQEKGFVLVAQLPDESERTYTGKISGNKLTLQSPADADGNVHQIVVTQLNEKRTLVLFQVRPRDQQQFTRVAEVGYTREGTKLAEEGVGGPECIVTGGKGTMSTVYKGKTYWFCCTGCRDAFMDDPDAIIAQAEQKAAKKKEAAKSGK